MEKGEVVELAKHKVLKNENAENILKRTLGIDSMLHQPQPMVEYDSDDP